MKLDGELHLAAVEHKCVRELLQALYTIDELHSLGDSVYVVRERAAGDSTYTGNSWEHPKVKAYGDAHATLQRLGVLAR